MMRPENRMKQSIGLVSLLARASGPHQRSRIGDQTRTTRPGLSRLVGSSARLMVRIRSSATADL